MKSCFSDLPVKDGKSGTWKLDTFEITTDKALTLALRAECTGNTDEFIPPGRYRRLSNGWDVVMSNTSDGDPNLPGFYRASHRAGAH